MRRPKLDFDKRMAIGRAKLAGEDPRELARANGVGLTTVYAYAHEAEQFQRSSPMQEFGVSGLARFGGSVQEDYDKAWKTLSDLVHIVKEMMDHPIVGAALFTIEMSVKRAEWSVSPASELAADTEAADFLESCLDDMSHTFDDHISQVVSMFAYGFAPFEIVYKRRLGPAREPSSLYDDGRIGWRKLAIRAQDTLAPGKEWDFDENGGLQGMYQQAPPDWQQHLIPIDKLLLYRTTALKGNPQGRSSLRSAYMPWYYSKNLTNVEAIAAERLGAGLPVVYLGKKTNTKGDNSDFAYAKQAVRDTRIDEQAGLVFPYPKQTADGEGVLFELVSPPARGGVDFNQIITRHNQQIAQSLLAQFIFLGLTEYGTQALASELKNTFAEAVAGWLKNIAATLNQYAVPRLFGLNDFPGITAYPVLVPGDVGDIELDSLMTAIEKAVGSGVLQPDEGTERRVRRALRLPQRDEQQAGELLYKPAPARPPAQPAVNAPVAQEKPPELASDMFARVRGRGRRAAQPWEKTVNEYQRALGATVDAWAEELSEDISETDDDNLRDEILMAALMRLSHEMKLLGRANILDAVASAVGAGPWRKTYIDIAGRHMASNEDYIEDSLTRDMRKSIRDLIGAGLIGAALKDAIIGSFSSRAELYAGEAWGALQETVGESSKFSEDPRVFWRRDPQAQHCATCLEYGDQEYDSYDAMLEQTGGSAPGIETDCDGNCRCWLETIGENGDFGRPSYFFAPEYAEQPSYFAARQYVERMTPSEIKLVVPKDAFRIEAHVTIPDGAIQLETNVAAPKVEIAPPNIKVAVAAPKVDVAVAAPNVTVPVSVPKDAIRIEVDEDVEEHVDIERGPDSLVKKLIKRKRRAKHD